MTKTIAARKKDLIAQLRYHQMSTRLSLFSYRNSVNACKRIGRALMDLAAEQKAARIQKKKRRTQTNAIK